MRGTVRVKGDWLKPINEKWNADNKLPLSSKTEHHYRSDRNGKKQDE